MKENDNSAKKSVTRTSSQVMDLQQLIAGPLIATVEADAMSAQRYYSYLMKIAFEDYDPATNSASRLRMLTFNYFDNDANGRREQTVSIPLFTIIPLPLLQIQEADFDFDIKIVDSITEAVGIISSWLAVSFALTAVWCLTLTPSSRAKPSTH